MGKKKQKDEIPRIMTLTDPEQLKALSVPIRIRILETICEQPMTTKQVADELGENPTRLYHHVDALEKAGLIRLVETKPKRGTLEKYYGAVAQQFRADVSLSSPSDSEETTDLTEIGARLLDAAAVELRSRSGPPGDADDGLFAQVKVRASRQTMVKLRKRFERILNALSELDDPDEEESFHLTMALYPDEKK